jgi:hypothetical protein
MAIIPSIFDTQFEAMQSAKAAFLPFNEHPNRLSRIAMSGTATVESDPRTIATGLSCVRSIWEYDYSLLPAWERLMRPKTPILQTSNPSTVGKFHFTQDVRYFWRCYLAFGPAHAPVTIGQVTDYRYTRPLTSSPWVLDTETSYDITGIWTPEVSAPYYGGHPLSGGRGNDDLDNCVALNPPQLGFMADALVARLPWGDPWSTESDAFTESLTTALAELNTAASSVWSGTTTAAMVFS